jgi:hypothetical protein
MDHPPQELAELGEVLFAALSEFWAGDRGGAELSLLEAIELLEQAEQAGQAVELPELEPLPTFDPPAT